MLPVKIRTAENMRLSERGVFRSRLDGVLNQLIDWEQIPFESELQSHTDFLQLRRGLEKNLEDLSDPEKNLFHNLFDLFEIKHGVGEGNKILREQLQQSQAGRFVGFLGPLGVGKSTTARVLTEDLKAGLVIREPYEKNPFWRQSQEYPKFMLRSQMYFFFSNIFSDMRTRLHRGTSVSDTSSLTDILMWADWYHQTSHLTDEEYKTYKKMVEILKPIVPKPDLLVALIPENVDDLREGINRRAAAEPQRRGELVFTTDESQGLKIQTETTSQLIEEIPHQWDVPVLAITVPPIKAYEDPSLPYDYVYQIRGKLGLLGELLDPKPEEVAGEVMRILADSKERQVVIIHAESMFTGKTTVLWLLAKKLGKEKAFVFQPRAAIHSAKKDNAVITRDQQEIEGITIETNSLETIVKMIKEQKINPTNKPYIFIDEIQLFIGHKDNHQQAIVSLGTLRQMGFHVILDGIDYTFQEEPFTFMDDLLQITTENPNWHQIEMSTRCRYCDKRAAGTRRWKILPNGERVIAEYSDTTFVAGDSEYEPVCCQGNHVSCLNQPTGFQRKELPVKN